MKYFLDTEFIEGFHKPLFGKRRHHIDLISIGIQAEDGTGYSAISSEYNYRDASKWVRENVIDQLYRSFVYGDGRNHFTPETFHKTYGKPNKQIAEEIFQYLNPQINTERVSGYDDGSLEYESYLDKYSIICLPSDKTNPYHRWRAQPEFYGYYADYDWVLFCSLYGTMMDLPEGYPMFCNDLKQMLNDKAVSMARGVPLHDAVKKLKAHPDFPKQENEHDALFDAMWNYKLYKFLQVERTGLTVN